MTGQELIDAIIKNKLQNVNIRVCVLAEHEAYITDLNGSIAPNISVDQYGIITGSFDEDIFEDEEEE